MTDLNTIFMREFKQTMRQRRAITSNMSLVGLEMPGRLATPVCISPYRQVHIQGIDCEYYDKLNDTDACLLSRPSLLRRKFDSSGSLIKDKDGNYVTENVPVPRECCAIVSSVKVGVPLKFSSKDETFIYVDYIAQKGNKNRVKYIYIVPKKYCYEINQTALILSLNKIRGFYYGERVTLQNGFDIYFYVVPYKPTTSARAYHVVATKNSDSYTAEINAIKDLWSQRGILFPPDLLAVPEDMVAGGNLGYELLNPTFDIYEKYDLNTSLARVGDDIFWGNE